MEQVRDLHSTLTDTCLDKITENDKTKLKRPVDFFCHPAKKLIGRILSFRCVYTVIRNVHDLSVNGSVAPFWRMRVLRYSTASIAVTATPIVCGVQTQ